MRYAYQFRNHRFPSEITGLDCFDVNSSFDWWVFSDIARARFNIFIERICTSCDSFIIDIFSRQ